MAVISNPLVVPAVAKNPLNELCVCGSGVMNAKQGGEGWKSRTFLQLILGMQASTALAITRTAITPAAAITPSMPPAPVPANVTPVVHAVAPDKKDAAESVPRESQGVQSVAVTKLQKAPAIIAAMPTILAGSAKNTPSQVPQKTATAKQSQTVKEKKETADTGQGAEEESSPTPVQPEQTQAETPILLTVPLLPPATATPMVSVAQPTADAGSGDTKCLPEKVTAGNLAPAKPLVSVTTPSKLSSVPVSSLPNVPSATPPIPDSTTEPSNTEQSETTGKGLPRAQLQSSVSTPLPNTVKGSSPPPPLAPLAPVRPVSDQPFVSAPPIGHTVATTAWPEQAERPPVEGSSVRPSSENATHEETTAPAIAMQSVLRVQESTIQPASVSNSPLTIAPAHSISADSPPADSSIPASPALSTAPTSEAPTPPTFQVQSARLIQSPERSEMRIGVQSESLGQVEIHAVMQNNAGSAPSVGASIAVQDRQTHDLLVRELPALQSHLEERNVPVGEIKVIPDSLSAGAGMQQFGSTSQEQYSRQQQTRGTYVHVATDPRIADTAATPESVAASWQTGSGRLSVMA